MIKTFFILSLFLVFNTIQAQNPNVLKFDYDAAGNQVKRSFIYVESGIAKQSASGAETAPREFVPTDNYPDVSYYPNPVKEELFVRWKNKASNLLGRMELYSSSGAHVRSYDNLKGTEETSLSFSALPSGLYNLLLLYTGGEQKTLKIIKR